MYIYFDVGKQMIGVELFLVNSITWNHLSVGKQMINSQ